MTGSKRDLTVLIGRFSLFHVGHAELLERALNLSNKVIVVIGSTWQPRTTKNPFTGGERAAVIMNWYENWFNANAPRPGSDLADLEVVFARDYRYNNTKWLAEVQAEVRRAAPDAREVYLTGSERDASTFYLQMLLAQANWKRDFVEENRNVSKVLSATALRNLFFRNEFEGNQITDGNREMLLRAFIPHESRAFLERFKETPAYSLLLEEFEVERKKNEAKKALSTVRKYPIIEFAADAVVFQTGHILLVQRRAAPGKGLWALPGGHVDEFEWTFDTAVRELYEETKLDVPELALRNSLKFNHFFEHPDRSPGRGRVVSMAYCFELADIVVDGKIKLPKVKGSDDAVKAKWFPVGEAINMSDQLFDDHWDIISDFADRLERANVGGKIK